MTAKLCPLTVINAHMATMSTLADAAIVHVCCVPVIETTLHSFEYCSFLFLNPQLQNWSNVLCQLVIASGLEYFYVALIITRISVYADLHP